MTEHLDRVAPEDQIGIIPVLGRARKMRETIFIGRTYGGDRIVDGFPRFVKWHRIRKSKKNHQKSVQNYIINSKKV